MIAALNKFWRPLTTDQYKDELGLPDTQNAIEMAQFPKEVAERIWQKNYGAFEVY